MTFKIAKHWQLLFQTYDPYDNGKMQEQMFCSKRGALNWAKAYGVIVFDTRYHD